MDHREELMRAFHIDREDLQANRAGVLGHAQVRRLIRSGYWNIIAALAIGLGLAAILYWVATKPLALIQWILVSALFVAALAVGIVYFRHTRASVAEGRVDCLTGPVRVQMRGPAGVSAGQYLVVAGRSFKLPVRFWHVQSDGRYRVYVAPRAHCIVAMEPDDDE